MLEDFIETAKSPNIMRLRSRNKNNQVYQWRH